MIVLPIDWMEVGKPITIKDIELGIMKVLSEIGCNCLSFSGGLDSSLMLYFMLKRHRRVRTFTIGLSEDHPDVVFSRLVVEELSMKAKAREIIHKVYIPSQGDIGTWQRFGKEEFEGDFAVRMFYTFISHYTDTIIACDGIDEFMAGYYSHQKDPSETTYVDFIRRLREEHLAPLNKNSGKVKVFLPYLDSRLLLLYSQIPLSEKVDEDGRKKLMVRMAEGKIPERAITRRKYGFCDALKIKEECNASIA